MMDGSEHSIIVVKWTIKKILKSGQHTNQAGNFSFQYFNMLLKIKFVVNLYSEIFSIVYNFYRNTCTNYKKVARWVVLFSIILEIVPVIEIRMDLSLICWHNTRN